MRRTGVSLASCLLLAGAAGLAQPPDELTLVSPVDRFALPVVRSTPGDQEFVRLTELAGLFDLGVPEQARPDTITITNGARALILTADQRVVSVAGRLISLRSSAPRREDGGWLVPVEFLSRALGPLIEQTISLRPDSRLVLIGDVAVPSVSGRTRTQGADAYLEFDVRPSTPHQVTRQGQQLVVAFDADALDIGRLPSPHGNLLSGIRADAARNRIVLDLGPAFQSFEVASRSIRRGEQVSIALRADRPARAAVDPAPAASGRLLPDLDTAAAIRVVAVDAGHGGADEGVVGSGEIREKDITLSVAQRLHDAIVERLGLRVILTRDVDRTVSLDERAAVANTNRADLLISLHVNASVRPWARGAEVFFLHMGEDGRKAQATVEHDARVVRVVGGGQRAIALVPWDLAQIPHLAGSAELAAIVHQELGRRVRMSPRGVQEAPFRVLVGANMPAVVVELGFISNRGDAERLASEPFQTAVVEALVASIRRYGDHVRTGAAAAAGDD